VVRLLKLYVLTSQILFDLFRILLEGGCCGVSCFLMALPWADVLRASPRKNHGYPATALVWKLHVQVSKPLIFYEGRYQWQRATAVPVAALIRRVKPTATRFRLQEWDWKEHSSGQPENERYLNYVADKFDLRRDIRFNSQVTSAIYDELANRWEVQLENGQRIRLQFLPRRSESCPRALYPHSRVSIASRASRITPPGG
jgi:hypothetical protein